VYIPQSQTILGEVIIEENIPRATVIKDNEVSTLGREDPMRLSKITEISETWKQVEVPASSLDVKSVPKENLNIDAMKLPQKPEVIIEQSQQKIQAAEPAMKVKVAQEALKNLGYIVKVKKTPGTQDQYISVKNK